MKLEFKPLPGETSFIQNAVVQVNEHFNVSVSYNGEKGLWFVGAPGEYEVAIQASVAPYKYRSLVSLADNPHGSNLYYNCDDAAIEALIEKVKTLVYSGEIQVFDRMEGQTVPAWGHRFYCAEGHDEEEKRSYVERVWGEKNGWRFIPATATVEF